MESSRSAIEICARRPPVRLAELAGGEGSGSAAPATAGQSDGLRAFVDSVAAPTATPGGGAVAALAGALAAALTTMVAGLTLGNKRYAEVGAEMGDLRMRS